ncbi:DUF4159 domain-containing protein [Aquicoccus porphyridii]|uniref:DUF4159 domain-containing protein n=1 Tax=Aquicoccus porphyridii TaxID=1852029 RepID=UPI00273DEA2B|nr:DUF4159 domain-containing protein [Aquicoccus porphyridii]
MIGALAFTAPWLLLALLALPVLWILLRAVPPAPIRRRFPAVTLLLGLKDDDNISDRTPWWLLLLRTLAVAAIIIGLAGPVLNPEERGPAGQGPLLVVMDGGWASADDWDARVQKVDELLTEASRAGRAAAVTLLTRPEAPVFVSASDLRNTLAGLHPAPWLPTPERMERFAELLPEGGDIETVWLSDGLERDGRAALFDRFEGYGRTTILESNRPVQAIAAPRYKDGAVEFTLSRSATGTRQPVTVQFIGTDPNGTEAVLAEQELAFEPDQSLVTESLSLPAEMRGRVSRLTLKGVESAGAVALSDDSLGRREVALISTRENREGLELLSPLHFLRNALEPNADLLEGALGEVLPANPDVVILADIAELAPDDEAALTAWVEDGGLLLRFAGPRIAASDISRQNEHPLMPVRLRAGGRTVGGAMSWGEPKTLAPFDDESPFAGLDIPSDVTVNAQVLAQPDPSLSDRVFARLSDDTPLVTSKAMGAGRVTFFHVTANAEWSTLPLSGLFVDMLDRLSVATFNTPSEPQDLSGTFWQPVVVLDGYGRLEDGSTLPGVDGEALVAQTLGPEMRAGLYQRGDRAVSRNVLGAKDQLAAMSWPEGARVLGMTRSPEQPLAGWFLALSLVLLGLDILASLALSGRLSLARGAGAAGIVAVAILIVPPKAMADDDRAIEAASRVVFAHVLTGNSTLDDTARAGLVGLSTTLFRRTSVEPGAPVGVDLEQDELAFYPFLYWPITPEQSRPSDSAYEKLNQYLRSGGMILFDTRDGDISGYGTASPNGRKLQQLARPLDIPPIEPVPSDHVLTRTFYLLQEFPGRYRNRDIWVEASPPDAEQVEGMPFRNLNDGVTPVVIGGNDWAAAWAMDDRGNPVYPVGRGLAGDRQREMAYRFGVNLIMYVLTGNYKSDQVHVPALLDRLGQ